jgi:DegV family protein with EDD domain
MLRIIADSTCNLPPEWLEEHAVRIAPISIQFGNQAFDEDITIDRETFYRKVDEMQIIPTTSQPSPAWFSRYYQEAVDAGLPCLVITVTAKHSGTYQSALLAKSMVPGADVEVFDSASISLGTGMMVQEAVQANQAGQDRASILERLQAIRARSHLFLTPATLKYLQMSGRVGKLQGALASLLNVKPIISVKDGLLEAGENIRTRGKAVERILELAEQAVGRVDPVHLAVIHARAPEEARELLRRVEGRLRCIQTMTGDLVSSLAVHGGPGVIGLAVYRD